MIDLYLNLPVWVQSALKGLIAIGVLIPIAGACSMAERKISAWIQGRPGPNRAIVPWVAWIPFFGRFLQRLGVFHLMADGAKFVFKEDVVPGHVNKFYYYIAPLVALVPALCTVVVVPFGAYFDAATETLKPLILADVDIGLIAVFAIGSLGVYALILAGWASNSKYPFLGGVRASAQLISYELSMTLSVIPVFLWVNAPGGNGTMSLFDVVQAQSGPFLSWSGVWFVFYMPLCAFVFLIALFAETNRQPFDMPESEADLVGGFHTEYGEFKWSIFFVAEYAHMTIGSGVFVLLFLGGWNPLPWVPLEPLISGLPMWLGGLIAAGVFLGKTFFFIFLFMWVRWTLPRFRYDQVMKLGWQKLLPLAIGNVIFYALAIAVIELS
ncbi:complex I subunit 1/NuoH family protein [Synoicihabitans lomoniglobus]|uniref:NADH-quinone oxidoreductase subunit H n=1 Tax=Synoicihabitans lomoniglobus TaxID=2909285 RepID=A0AAE9ZXB1_9BACT|nr:NADH-quinone oxidoreductase subunit H [Opitutaceae bacterium LMO-M01]WED64944.1 NADH-quinone oxidoreductase subunit H [Opitutaceae bacterium LMO-M01]